MVEITVFLKDNGTVIQTFDDSGASKEDVMKIWRDNYATEHIKSLQDLYDRELYYLVAQERIQFVSFKELNHGRRYDSPLFNQ